MMVIIEYIVILLINDKLCKERFCKNHPKLGSRLGNILKKDHNTNKRN